jgi:hypothetical protein
MARGAVEFSDIAAEASRLALAPLARDGDHFQV